MSSAVASPQVRMSNLETILSSAAHIFLEFGYGGATIERVAQCAGVSRRTVYNQFPKGKAALLQAVVKRMWAEFETLHIASDENALNNPEEGLRHIAQATVNFWQSPLSIRFLRIVIGEGMRFPHLTQIFFEKGVTPSMEATRLYIEALSLRGLLLVDNAEDASRQFLGLLDEPLLWTRLLSNNDVLTAEKCNKVIDDAVAIFLNFYQV